MSVLLAAAFLVSCKGPDEETDTGDPIIDTDTDCESSDWFTDADADGYGDDATLVAACEKPNGAVAVGGDCDDADDTVHPGATELCNDADDDCDGTPDEDVDLATFWADSDADGYGNDAEAVQACEAPEGYVDVSGDCDDANVAFHPGADETDCADPADYNCDGSTGYLDNDKDGYAACEECADDDPLINPDMLESCNEVDDDCDGEIDEDALGAATWYEDVDGDGFGVDTSTMVGCEPAAGFVSVSGDCDDTDIAYNPGATESCDDPNDYNCDGSVEYADVDGDGFAACEDCDDADDDVNPDGVEVCNGIDDDCTGTADDGATDAPTWYLDNDLDGWGDSSLSVEACEAPSNHVSLSDDCDDADAAFHPSAAETCDDPTDYNCDGSVAYDDNDADGFPACSECDDDNAAINPDAVETCNGADDDCDGIVDGPDAEGVSTWYRDADGDGFGDAATSVVSCTAPTGFVADNTDCDDTNDDLNPDTAWFADDDKDGFGDASDTMASCEQPSGYVADATDCDDALATVNPDGSEICNDIDDDCDGKADNAATDAPTWYADGDGDGFGDASEMMVTCDAPTGFVSDATDCDDTVDTTFPGADETCNLEDDDCNGTVDDDYATDATAWYFDADGDTYGAGEAALACDAPTDYVADDTDCDDENLDVNPGAAEVCDSDDIDEDCSGDADNDDASATGKTTFYTDADSDTYGTGSGTALCDATGTSTATKTGDCNDGASAVNPGATEVCDAANTDEDCDGSADNADSSATGKTTYYTDFDSDTYGTGSGTALCDATATASATRTGDCDDAASAINPGATEVCDAADADEDCDGSADNADSSATGKKTYYTDADSDTYGTGSGTALCDVTGTSTATMTGDCNDASSAINPGATEVCDAANTDEDCDGSADNADSSATGKSTYYTDADSDTYGTGSGTALCDATGTSTATATGDCNDSASSIHPGATEVCDAANADEDCDGSADDLDSSATGKKTWYTDADSDSYGIGAGTSLCDATGSSTATMTGDCNDAASAINPGATEVCDASDVDEDCDGNADDLDSSASGKKTYYTDSDGDSYGHGVGAAYCDPTSGLVTTTGDCNDASSAINPGATEVCDEANTDEDCDGKADDLDSSATGKSTYYVDKDGDTYAGTAETTCDGSGSSSSSDCNDASSSINPGATEINGDGIDQDCDGKDPAAVSIDYAHHQWECSYEVVAGDDITGYGWVYAAGVTDSVGQGAGITAQFGYGPAGDDPASTATWTWVDAEYNTDTNGTSNDEYVGTLSIEMMGDYEVAWRFSTNEGATWFYGDLGGDGSDEGCGGSGSSDGWTGGAPVIVAGADTDKDGYYSEASGGDDCDDTSSSVHPGATEVADDGVDNDCASGDLVSVSKVGVGDLVITEIMYNPAVVTDELGEYLEIYNPTDDTISLTGMFVTDGSTSGGNTFTVTGSLTIAPGDWFVLGRTTDTTKNDGVPVEFGWGTTSSTFPLGQSGKTIQLKTASGGTTIDEVIYKDTSPWPTGANGLSLELDKDFYTAADNGVGSSWCKAAASYSVNNKGTPGAANTGC